MSGISKLVKAVADAIDDVTEQMNRDRDQIPRHKRERFFGVDGEPGFKEKLLEAQAKAAIAVVEAQIYGRTP